MRLSGLVFLIVFLLIFPLAASAEDDIDPKKTECIVFYDENKKAYEEKSEKLIAEDNEREVTKKEKELMASIIQMSHQIADNAEKCGKYDERYYQEQSGLCLGYMRGSDEWRKIYDLAKKPFPYCKQALKRGDAMVAIDYLIFYARGDYTPKNYKKAAMYIEGFAQEHPDKDDILFFAVPLYERGGFGLEKNKTRAFEIVQYLAEKGSKGNVPCYLSLYHKNGIGTPKDEQTAEKWFKIYKEQNPKKECQFFDFSYFIESRYHKTKDTKSESATIDSVP